MGGKASNFNGSTRRTPDPFRQIVALRRARHNRCPVPLGRRGKYNSSQPCKLTLAEPSVFQPPAARLPAGNPPPAKLISDMNGLPIEPQKEIAWPDYSAYSSLAIL